MNVVVDSGNSAAKVGIFDNQNLREKRIFPAPDTLRDFLGSNVFDNMIVSSVNIPAKEIISWGKRRNADMVLNNDLPLPLVNLYKTPETLGVDRIAAASGAHNVFPGADVLVIDAGTCITYDFVDRHGAYHGGGISPGLSMRFKAVHTFTARLPLISPAGDPLLIGNTTETSIQSGIIIGLLSEIEGITKRYQALYPDVKAIICGGDTAFFENRFKASIFAAPDLVLMGLNSILIHNVNR